MKPSNVTYSMPEKGSDSQVKVRSNQSESRVNSGLITESLKSNLNSAWDDIKDVWYTRNTLPEGNVY